jgi:hypothetical protein
MFFQKVYGKTHEPRINTAEKDIWTRERCKSKITGDDSELSISFELTQKWEIENES